MVAMTSGRWAELPRWRRTSSLIAVVLVCAWWTAYGVEWAIESRARRAGFPGRGVTVVVHPVSPGFKITSEELARAVRDRIQTKAPWVRLVNSGEDRLELDVSLKTVNGASGVYTGWVQLTFRRSRWLRGMVNRRPDWSRKVVVLGVQPRENVLAVLDVLVESFVRQALSRPAGPAPSSQSR